MEILTRLFFSIVHSKYNSGPINMNFVSYSILKSLKFLFRAWSGGFTVFCYVHSSSLQ